MFTFVRKSLNIRGGSSDTTNQYNKPKIEAASPFLAPSYKETEKPPQTIAPLEEIPENFSKSAEISEATEIVDAVPLNGGFNITKEGLPETYPKSIIDEHQFINKMREQIANVQNKPSEPQLQEQKEEQIPSVETPQYEEGIMGGCEGYQSIYPVFSRRTVNESHIFTKNYYMHDDELDYLSYLFLTEKVQLNTFGDKTTSTYGLLPVNDLMSLYGTIHQYEKEAGIELPHYIIQDENLNGFQEGPETAVSIQKIHDELTSKHDILHFIHYRYGPLSNVKDFLINYNNACVVTDTYRFGHIKPGILVIFPKFKQSSLKGYEIFKNIPKCTMFLNIPEYQELKRAIYAYTDKSSQVSYKNIEKLAKKINDHNIKCEIIGYCIKIHDVPDILLDKRIIYTLPYNSNILFLNEEKRYICLYAYQNVSCYEYNMDLMINSIIDIIASPQKYADRIGSK